MSIALMRFGCIYCLSLPPLLCYQFGLVSMAEDVPFQIVFGRGILLPWHLKTNAPNLASAAKDIPALMMVAFVRIAPLFGGEILLFDRNKCPPAQLRAFFSLQYPASL